MSRRKCCRTLTTGAQRVLERVFDAAKKITSAIIASDSGIHWKTIHRTAELVKFVAEHSVRSSGHIQLAATAMLKPPGPFYPGAYHTGGGKQFAIGFEGAGRLVEVFARDKGDADVATTDLTAALTKHARVADGIGNRIAAQTGWEFVGVDPTPAPLGDVSIAAAIENFTGAKFG